MIRETHNLPPSQTYDSRYSPVQVNKDFYSEYTKEIKRLTKHENKQAKKDNDEEFMQRRKELYGYRNKFFTWLHIIWKYTVAKLGEDWIFLAFLGTSMAVISFIIDKLVLAFSTARMYLFRDLAYYVGAKYFAWLSLPVILILFNTGFVYLVGPQSVGSGLAEVKTILRGVVLKEYLTFRVLVAKVIGLACTIGSGMPLGKEGPLVHMSSIITNLYGKFIGKMRQVEDFEMRKTEMIAAAAAVGVATTFASPVGGVLFSIEVTTAYFAVRNYFRGFFAAVCGALLHRLLVVWFDGVNTLVPVFKTNFFVDLPFDPPELVAFAIIGIICGIGGAAWVWIHRQYVLFTKNNLLIKYLNQNCRFIYPLFVVLIISSITFPPGIGRYLAGSVAPAVQVKDLFANFTWMHTNLTIEQEAVLANWKTPSTGPYLHLCCYMAYMFFGSIIASTMPVPNGTFIPTFRVGAAFGRIVGELMHSWYPTGLYYRGKNIPIIAGGYATVGAAAFAGSVTQTLSVAIIVFEMTGQISHLLPILIAVLIANFVSSKIGVSIYDSVVMMKKLPYLPDLLPSSYEMYDIHVENFMIKDVKYVFQQMSLKELTTILKENKEIKSFPLVNNSETRNFLGSIKRKELIRIIEKQVGRKKRIEYLIAQKHLQESPDNESDDKTVDQESKDSSRLSFYDNVYYFEPEQAPSTAEAVSSNDSPTFTYSPSLQRSTSDSKLGKAFSSIFSKQPKDKYGTYSSVLIVSSKSKDKIPQIVPPKDQGQQTLTEIICDMTPNEQKSWEDHQLESTVDFDLCHVDPAPFQLVKKTSLLKVHSLFSLMGLNRAYVTDLGRLVGVVALKDLRKTIEEANSKGSSSTFYRLIPDIFKI